MDADRAYEALLEHWREAQILASTAAVLEWEQQTTMPARGAEHRAAQLAQLAGLHHQRVTDQRIGEWLGEVEGSALARGADSPQGVNIREIRRAYDKATKLPQKLVEELANTFSLAQQEWMSARKAQDFARFRPWLAKVFDLSRQKARALDPHAPVYDTLMDDYERNAKAEAIAPLFRDLREKLVPLIRAIGEAKTRPDASILERNYPVDRQQVFGEMVASEIGFNFSRGRLDTTTHPFCTTLGPQDCRILTRYNAKFFSESFFGILHEAGHGLYEQGLDPEHFGTPMGEAVSLGVHESQSRFWENVVGRSRPFWETYFPRARGVFREALSDVSVEAFHGAVNAVSPSFIRVEADEATYNLHIMIRFELEQALLNEDLSADAVPAAWNDKYQSYLGITPPNDALGCLQDIHWSAGLVGYFPTYTLGNMYAAQLVAALERDLGSLDALIRRGAFADILAWLRDRIHRHGKRYEPAELIQQVTGESLSADPLLEQLRAKYAAIYSF